LGDQLLDLTVSTEILVEQVIFRRCPEALVVSRSSIEIEIGIDDLLKDVVELVLERDLSASAQA
jgi:hypothetical protein